MTLSAARFRHRLFLGAGGRLAQGGPRSPSPTQCGVFAFLMVRALGELAVSPSSGAFRVLRPRAFLGEKGVHHRLVLPGLGCHRG